MFENKGLKWIQFMGVKLSLKKNLNSVFRNFPGNDHLTKNKEVS